MVILCVAILTALVLVASIIPPRRTMSTFELERRSAHGDQKAIEVMRREKLLPHIASLQRIAIALLLVLFVVLSVLTFEWLLGIAIAVIVALEYGRLARLSFIHGYAERLYTTYEASLLAFIERFPRVFQFVESVTFEEPSVQKLGSREELEHLVSEASNHILSGEEKKLLLHGLTFQARRVKEVMTPRGVIDSIAKRELLGPLVLDDLHKTGHSRFPVIDEDIDHVIGILHIQDLLTLSAKRSITAEKAMEPRVFYIHEDQTLDRALAAFLRTRHHLFVVVNEFRETVGLLSLEDAIEALLGRKIIDEFDKHEDLRAVAMQNPRGNNYPESHEDI